ncbi:MAG: STAS domain-containing protein [Rhodanobacteraceae bacterium]
MIDIRYGEDHHHVVLSGRLDASQAARAGEFMDTVEVPCVIDVAGLEYISSAGLGVLLKTHKRLMAMGAGLSLINVNPHIHDVFRYSGMDKLFSIAGPQPG